MRELNQRVMSILTDRRIKKDKFERIKDCLILISLEIEKNKIETEGLISEKVTWKNNCAKEKQT